MYGVTSDNERTNQSMAGNEDIEAVDVTTGGNLRKDRNQLQPQQKLVSVASEKEISNRQGLETMLKLGLGATSSNSNGQ